MNPRSYLTTEHRFARTEREGIVITATTFRGS